MSVEKVANGVKTVGALVAILGVKVVLSDEHGDVDSVKLFGVIPLFRRDKNGKARILGIPAKRLSR